MFYSFDRNYRAAADAENINYSHVRFLNAAPDLPEIIVLINDMPLHEKLDYRGFTDYNKAFSGRYNIKIQKREGSGKNYIDEDVIIDSEMVYTIAVSGTLDNYNVDMFSDTLKNTHVQKTAIRFINLSHGASPIDLYLNNTKIIADMNYEEYSNYVPMEPGTYKISVNLKGSDKVVLTDPKATLKGGKFYAFYIVGKLEGTPGLQGLIPLEGSTYLTF